MPKQAALLINLGSPDSTDPADVRRYLAEFLGDERVIDLPFVRKVVVPGIILNTRPKKSAEAYAEVWTEEGSPLIVVSEHQQQLVSARVDLPVYLAMRYANPSIRSVLEQILRDGVEELFVLPLYPHYAMSSYETVVVKVMEEVKALGVEDKLFVEHLQPFYNDPQYLDAVAESARPYVEKNDGWERILFSFHGVPERQIRKSDPSHAHCLVTRDCCTRPNPAHHTCYRHQCYYTMQEVAKRLGLRPDQYFMSFQSRLGSDPWLRPFTDHTLKEWAANGVKRIKVICPAFVTDCLETLEEIAGEGAEDFKHAGGEAFELIPCMNEHPAWIQFMVDRIQQWQAGRQAAI
ncbi:MAG: ferrochelatase [Verrucomicrobiota bacterium JB022]|nr:ferrochelatase [Verrucomicrobiota bacterium JB022]